MFKRHITRLVSIALMVLVSIGFISGIFSAKDKMDSSLAEYRDAQKVSDIVLLSEEGNFSEDDVSLLQTRYGAENVLTGGMLEFEVKEGKATIDDTQLTFTGVPDGIVRVYLFECDSPEELTQNTLTETEAYEVSSEGIEVYAERSTVQLPSYATGQTFSMETVIESTQIIEQDTPFGSFEIEADVSLNVRQDYVLKGTLFNPMHMATRDDQSFTAVPDSEDDEMLDLSAIFYVFGTLVDTTADGTATVGENVFDLTDQAVTISASNLRNRIAIRLPDAGELFSSDYDAAIDSAVSSLNRTAFSVQAEALTLHENFSFESFRQYGDKIAGIGFVLMFVFLFVTVLVVLSTMTRLLDEERGQIACMLTLGYSSTQIVSKYWLFALVGTLIGGAGAYFAGLGIARIIYANFTWNFALPPYSSHIAILYYIITFAVILVSALAATSSAGHKLAREEPANLLRPKTPKAGKKVFLERIPLIWNRLSFKYKSTMRNVLRFFTRFVMTVVSVSLSTALVLAGLAILDCCLFQNIGGTAMIAMAIVVLIFAALLNFVVIYTLTNINISERERELATLMVLGYLDREVAGYIYREIYITSGIGILLGLPFGCLLCMFIFRIMEFGSVAGMNWFVWVLAPVLSVIFTILVTLMLRHKIVRIRMNDSLKAVE